VLWATNGKEAFGNLIDEPNQRQISNRAHHDVDVLHLFGGFKTDPSNANSGVEIMRRKWIQFVNGLVPWDASGAFAFGPYSESK
jgi:hypothetical protein